MNHERINPSVNDNEAIRHACGLYFCSMDIVRLLLEDPRVDPSVRENECIRTASQRGHKEVVQLLLQDPRVDPSVDMNLSLRFAVENSDLEVTKILLDDDRIDTKQISNIILRAVGTGTLKIFKFLLEHPKLEIDLEQIDEDLIVVAAAHNSISILEFLLEDGRSIPKERAVSEASFLGFTETVEILLSDSRLNLRPAKAKYYLNRAKENKTPKTRYCSTCECEHHSK